MQMDLDLALDIFWIETWHFLALAVSLTVNGILIRRAEKSPLRNRYIAVQSCLLLWIASKILKTISPDADWRWAFIVLQYLGVSFLGFAFFRFAYLFVRRKDPPGVINAVLAIGSVCCFLLVASNPHHYRFYASYTFYRDTFGSLFYLTMGFQYAQVLAGLILLVFRIVVNRDFSAQHRLIGLAALIPLTVNVLYITRTIHPMFDITPITMTLVLVLFAIAAFRFRFLGILPLARQKIHEELTDPVVIRNAEGSLISQDARIQDLTSADGYADAEKGDILRTPEGFFRLDGRRKYRGWELEYWVDITELRRLEEEKNQALHRLESLEAEVLDRNAARLRTAQSEAIRYARIELHDLLGHSLTQVLMILRTARLQLRTNSGEVKETFRRAREACHRCLVEISTKQKTEIPEKDLLSSEIYRMAEAFVGSPLDVQILTRGPERHLSAKLHHTLLRCCQEAVTNAVKHGCPDEVTIVLRFEKKGLLLFIADNGIGCESISPGFGLTGMKERVKQIGGTLRYQSESGGGTMISVQIPTAANP